MDANFSREITQTASRSQIGWADFSLFLFASIGVIRGRLNFSG
jgi:hypothetical protein